MADSHAETGAVENECQHPSEWLAWNDERPLYCALCDAALQTEQPIIVIETPHQYDGDET